MDGITSSNSDKVERRRIGGFGGRGVAIGGEDTRECKVLCSSYDEARARECVRVSCVTVSRPRKYNQPTSRNTILISTSLALGLLADKGSP